jgi:hypothetical protein
MLSEIQFFQGTVLSMRPRGVNPDIHMEGSSLPQNPVVPSVVGEKSFSSGCRIEARGRKTFAEKGHIRRSGQKIVARIRETRSSFLTVGAALSAH